MKNLRIFLTGDLCIAYTHTQIVDPDVMTWVIHEVITLQAK